MTDKGPTSGDVLQAHNIPVKPSLTERIKQTVFGIPDTDTTSNFARDRKKAKPNMTGQVIDNFGTYKNENRSIVSKGLGWHETTRIKFDKLAFILLIINIVIVFIAGYTYFKYTRNLPEEHKTPKWISDLNISMYVLLVAGTIWQIVLSKGRVLTTTSPTSNRSANPEQLVTDYIHQMPQHTRSRANIPLDLNQVEFQS
jgi:hypothetical protein